MEGGSNDPTGATDPTHQGYPSPTITPSNNNNLGLSDPSSAYLNAASATAAANLWPTSVQPEGTVPPPPPPMTMHGTTAPAPHPADPPEGSPTPAEIKQERTQNSSLYPMHVKAPNSSPPISAAVSPHPSSHSSSISGGASTPSSGLTNGNGYQTSLVNNGAHFSPYGTANTHAATYPPPPPPHHNPYAAAYDLSYFGNHASLNQQYASHMSANMFRGMGEYGDATSAYSPERYHQLL